MGQAAVAVTPEERPAGFLALMRNRNYALLWSGQLVSEMGNRFHWVAVSLWIYSLTNSAAAVSFAISSMFAGSLLVSIWAGVLVDRLNRKTILVTSDLIRGVLVALMPSLARLDIRLIYIDLVLVSIATAFFRPAIFAIVPATVDRRNLLPANSFFTAMDTATEIGGPILAGVLAQGYGYAPLLYVDAVSYVFSAVCILGMHIPRSFRRDMPLLNLRGISQGVMDGVHYIKRDRLQWALFVLIFPSTLVGSGLNALQTPLAKGSVRITDAQFGTFQSVWGAGFLVASLLLGWFGTRVRKSLMILAGFFLAFLTTALMGLTRTLEQLLFTGFLVGFANTLYYVGIGTVLMEYTPQNLIGRVISTRQLALGIVRVISPLIFGALALVVGIREAIVAMAGVGTAGTILVVGLFPAIARFDLRGERQQPKSFLWKALSGAVDVDLDPTPQHRMNVLTLLAAGMTLLVLAYNRPFPVLGLIAILVAFTVLGGVFRRKGWLS